MLLLVGFKIFVYLKLQSILYCSFINWNIGGIFIQGGNMQFFHTSFNVNNPLVFFIRIYVFFHAWMILLDQLISKEQKTVWLEGSWSLLNALWQLHSLLFIQTSLKTKTDSHLPYSRGIWSNQGACPLVAKKSNYLPMLWWLQGPIFLLGLGGCSYAPILFAQYCQVYIDSMNLVW